MSLKSTKWKEFYIKDIFITKKSEKQVPTGSYVPKDKLEKGDTPRITVTSLNNGVDGCYYSHDANYREHKNFISVSFLGTVFYHPYKASIDMKVHCLQLKDEKLNVYLADFIITEIKKSIENASYGNQISSTDIPHKKIMLPVKDGSPDWIFMENYIQKKTESKKENYKEYAIDVLDKIKYKPTPHLHDKEWREFPLIKIFSSIKRGKRLTKANQQNGTTPYVSSSEFNNGVDNYINNKDKVRFFDNCLSIANSGSVGSSFYHPYKFVASDHITHLKNDNFNEHIYLFLSTITSRMKDKYNFNREINDKRLSKEKILLPINKNEDPDYEYMDQYMINLKINKLNQYLDYIN